MLFGNGRYDIMNEIICTLNKDDAFSIENSVFQVNLLEKKDYHYTFFKRKRRLYQFPNFFSKEALDLFYISLMVYYADRKILRMNSYDAWTRRFKIHMPVLEFEKWNYNKDLLEKTLAFLSGDIWEFEFRERNYNEVEKDFIKGFERTKKKYSPKAFCMLSGGLDSFIGAIDLLNDKKDIVFVSHYGGGKGVIQYQEKLKIQLKDKFKLNDNQFFNFYAAPLKGVEDTTRTRSFMFFAHAIILASGVGEKMTLYIPENGLISLNIPLTNTRLGTSSTRTTHPYYMNNLQLLLDSLGIDVELKNPYQFFTKGEMIENCKSPSFLESNIDNTMSCSSPDHGRFNGEATPSHCGTCLPCIIRRASIKKAYGTDESYYRDKDFKTLQAINELKSYKISLLEFKDDNSRFKIQESGPINADFENFTNLYKRGMLELASVINEYNEL